MPIQLPGLCCLLVLCWQMKFLNPVNQPFVINIYIIIEGAEDTSTNREESAKVRTE